MIFPDVLYEKQKILKVMWSREMTEWVEKRRSLSLRSDRSKQ